MAKNYQQAGDVFEWTNATGSDVASGAVVVIGQQIGVAQVDIANGAKGSVAMAGVYTVPKISAAVIAQGEAVVWDASAGAFDDNAATPAAGDVSGCCVAAGAAGNGVTSIAVKLNVGVGTVT